MVCLHSFILHEMRLTHQLKIISLKGVSYMDFYQNSRNNDSTQAFDAVAKPGNALASASMILGIVSIASAFLIPVLLPFVCGALAITFALLSKGYDNRLCGRAVAGLATAIAGIILHLITIITTIFLITNLPAYQEQFQRIYDQLYEETYGDDFHYDHPQSTHDFSDFLPGGLN